MKKQSKFIKVMIIISILVSVLSVMAQPSQDELGICEKAVQKCIIENMWNPTQIYFCWAGYAFCLQYLQ